jgi:hypothetical protein
MTKDVGLREIGNKPYQNLNAVNRVRTDRDDLCPTSELPSGLSFEG